MNNKLKRLLLKKFSNFLKKTGKFLIGTKRARHILYDLMPENELMICKTREDLYYVVNTSDKMIGKSIYKNLHSFDSQNLKAAIKLIGKDKSTIIDVGANVGTIGILGISCLHFKKCIAFEPDPRNFRLLQANVILNGLNKKFDLRNEAISNKKDGTMIFELSENNFGDHRVQVQKIPGILNEENRETISVSVNTLDIALKNYDLADCLLFMDTQGHEGNVLSGATNIIKSRVPIITEFWPYGLKRSNGLNLFYDVLSNSGYKSMWDLRYPDKKLEFSVEQIKIIELGLGEDGFADLVFC